MCDLCFFLVGISELAKTPEKASNYIYPLLSFAAEHIPKNKHQETPLYILCTAGMRILPERYSYNIIRSKYDCMKCLDLWYIQRWLELGRTRPVYKCLPLKLFSDMHWTLDDLLILSRWLYVRTQMSEWEALDFLWTFSCQLSIKKSG